MMVTTIVMTVVMMAMLMVVMMSVVFATVRRAGQITFEIRSDQFFHRRVWKPGAHGDAVMGKVGQGPPTDATSNDDLNTLFAQPTRKQSWLVRGGGNDLRANHGFVLDIGFHERELTAAAEVSVQAAVFMGNGNFHSWL